MRTPHTLLILLAALLMPLAGCDSTTDDGDGGGNDGSSVLGLWQELELDSAGNESLRTFWVDIAEERFITNFLVEDELEVDGAFVDCFDRDRLDVMNIDGDEWSYSDGEEDGETLVRTITINRDGDDLVIGFDDEDSQGEQRYRRSTRSDFTPLCD
ncbi:MAG: hypothetical protein ABJF88_03550 [Rhodothermales bacterium]